MWRTGLLVLVVSLGAITPGAALLALQQWGPVVLAIAGTAGTALAVATVAYRKAMSNARQLEAIIPHIPKRSTDTRIGNVQYGVSATPPEITPSSTAARTAITPSGGDTE